MLIEENVILGDKEFIYRYSDAGFYIRNVRTGELYVDAYDTIENKDINTYEETEEKIPEVDPGDMVF